MSSTPPTPYTADVESLRQHPVPEWFHDAKFGIFIHWGLYSFVAWAEKGKSMMEQQAEGASPDAGFRHNTYTEWYLNTIRIDGSPAATYHAETYGDDFDYDDFAPRFRDAAAGFNPRAWARLFARAGARYVVQVTKHHDGFLMWPSATPNPTKGMNWQMERDLVGELTRAVRDEGMRMGLYYSGGLDWTFVDDPITDRRSLIKAIPQSDEYAEYANAHWRELIERYQPVALWNDIGYPTAGNSAQLIADYYNEHPDGVVNNRFDFLGTMAGTAHADFTTPEYQHVPDITAHKWEICRGMGGSFAYNRLETDDDMLSPTELIHLLVDVVSKNGNVLLNVGPTADGSIPWMQVRRLIAIGQWLDDHGAAIYGTRPWTRAEGRTGDGLGVRFTAAGDTVYATVLGTPGGTEVVLEDVQPQPGSTVGRLGQYGELAWKQDGDDLVIVLPVEIPPDLPAVTFRIEAPLGE